MDILQKIKMNNKQRDEDFASGKLEIIAEYKAPKQRITIHYGYQIVQNHDQGEWCYSVEKIDLTHNQVIDFNEELSADTAWLLFHSHIQKNSEYGPGAWEAK